MTLDIDTDHGPYQALPYRDSDEGPDGAAYTVFGDGGYIAGYASETRAWDKPAGGWLRCGVPGHRCGSSLRDQL